MSSFKNNQPAKKPYCKVCHDAGKPESEYTSHYVRSRPDRTGKTTVTCPTLLATECRYCYKLGHTTKFCPVIEANKKFDAKAARQSQPVAEKKAIKIPTVKASFAVLAEDSDDEVEVVKVSEPVKIVEEFPSLGTATSSKQVPVMSGWASVAAKTKDQFEAEKYEQQLIANTLKRQVPPIVKKTEPVKKSWADWTDSEDEQEEFERCYDAVAAQKPILKASEIDWTAQDSESDEDW